MVKLSLVDLTVMDAPARRASYGRQHYPEAGSPHRQHGAGGLHDSADSADSDTQGDDRVMAEQSRLSDEAGGEAQDDSVQSRDAGYQASLNRAVRMLAAREHSAVELERKLRSKGCSKEMACLVVRELQAASLQSDERFVEVFVRSRLAKGFGPMHIRPDLGQRGVDEILIDEALTQTGEFWLEVAERSRRKRFGDIPDQGDASAWNAQARFLARRGFPSDVIYRLLGSQY